MLSEEVIGLRRQMEDSSKRGKSDSDAMYHLQMAQATLNERYAKLQKKNAELQKRLDQTMMKLVLALFYLITYTHFSNRHFLFHLLALWICGVQGNNWEIDGAVMIYVMKTRQ